jgi:hypothetical protein
MAESMHVEIVCGVLPPSDVVVLFPPAHSITNHA